MTTRTQLFAQLLNPTGELSQAFPAGSNAAPSIFTTGDTNTGVFFPAADNIGFATGGTIRGRWTTDGLCFGTDTAAANALDDYEEGTYTVEFSWTDGIGTMTYGGRAGRYTKIGNMVNVTGYVQISSEGTAGGNMRITLPFASKSVSNQYSAAAIWYNTVLGGAQNVDVVSFNPPGESLLKIYAQINGVVSEFGPAYTANTTDFSFNITYEVA